MISGRGQARVVTKTFAGWTIDPVEMAYMRPGDVIIVVSIGPTHKTARDGTARDGHRDRCVAGGHVYIHVPDRGLVKTYHDFVTSCSRSL